MNNHTLNNELFDNENEIMKKFNCGENENMNKSYISKFQYMDK